ncbi:copper resistance protein C [Pararobbsia alpina]|uniref:copper resistance CopC family protein n=1 Tax=Pararobbsia alpina TaxID=621374 RepID=UPI0039A4F4BB
MKYVSHSVRRAARVSMMAMAVGAAIACATPAFAHVFPKHQEPGAGMSVAEPKEVRIQFDGPLEPAFSTLTVTDAGGKDVESAKAAVDPAHTDTISVALPSLQAGKYTVHWAAVAADGHRTHGDYTFEVK